MTGRSPVDMLDEAACRPFRGECLAILGVKMVLTSLLNRAKVVRT